MCTLFFLEASKTLKGKNEHFQWQDLVEISIGDAPVTASIFYQLSALFIKKLQR